MGSDEHCKKVNNPYVFDSVAYKTANLYIHNYLIILSGGVGGKWAAKSYSR